MLERSAEEHGISGEAHDRKWFYRRVPKCQWSADTQEACNLSERRNKLGHVVGDYSVQWTASRGDTSHNPLSRLYRDRLSNNSNSPMSVISPEGGETSQASTNSQNSTMDTASTCSKVPVSLSIVANKMDHSESCREVTSSHVRGLADASKLESLSLFQGYARRGVVSLPPSPRNMETSCPPELPRWGKPSAVPGHVIGAYTP